MTIVMITRDAKEKDCPFCKPIMVGRLKRHTCTNPDADNFQKRVRLADVVCFTEFWTPKNNKS